MIYNHHTHGFYHSEDESGSEDAAELESYLYSQIHYQQDSPEPENLDPSQSEETTDFISISENKTETSSFAVRRISDLLSSTDASKPSQPRSDRSQPKTDSSKSRSDRSQPRTNRSQPSTPDPKNLVTNPLYEPSDSDTSDDEGIIIVSDSKEKFENTITISSDSEPSTQKPKPRRLTGIEKSFKEAPVFIKRKRKKEFYVAEFGSDFEDNFLSDDSSDNSNTSDDSVEILDESRLTLNVSEPVNPISSFMENMEHEDLDQDLPRKWNLDMKIFYARINHRNLNLNCEDLIDPNIPCTWRLDRADTNQETKYRSRYFNNKGRCNNCSETGHFARDCSAPLKQGKCFMCGLVGHKETRCPDNSCLRCGQPGFGFQSSCGHCRALESFPCKECGFNGHVKRDCPDLWRRFHQTTDGDLPQDTNSIKVSNLFWCCNCGRKGHLMEGCRRYLYSEYPKTSLKVLKYAKLDPVLEEQEEEEEPNPEKSRRNRRDKYADKKRKSDISSNSPRRNSGKKFYSRSEPSTPSSWEESLITTDLRDVINNIHSKPNYNTTRNEKREIVKIKRKAEEKEFRRVHKRKSFENVNSPFENSGKSKKEKKRQKFYNSVMRQQKQNFVDLSAVSKKRLHSVKNNMATGSKKKHKPKEDIHLPAFYKYSKKLNK